MRLRAIIVLVLVLICAGAPCARSAEALTQTLALDRFGITLRHPEGWSAMQEGERAWIVNAPQERATGAALEGLVQIFVTVEHRTDHADAVQRLREIASEFDAPVEYLMIDGWPALQRRVITAREQPGAERTPTLQAQILRITTAIAAGDLLIRAEARMPPDVGDATEQQVRAIESSIAMQSAGNEAEAQRAVGQLRATPRLAPLVPPRSTVKLAQLPQRQGMLEGPRLLLEGANARSEEQEEQSSERGGEERDHDADAGASGAASRVINGGFASEPEITVSTDGQKIVVAQQFAFSSSNDGGLTFPFSGNFPVSTGGDSSVAYGKSGTFFEGTINNSSSALNVSTNNGQSFSFRANAFTCPTTGANQCGFTLPNGTPFPDQEHIAADRFNASASGGDQVYFVWRQGNGNIAAACSTNGGQNFGAPSFTPGDFPRITVGQDGFVYVVYINGGNVSLTKFSSCQSGFTVQTGFPVTAANGIGVTCPVPGLDRCNNGNQLSSHTAAVDDGNANHLYVAYAQSSGNGESVVLQDSPDGGKTWSSSRAVTLSASTTARRYMPWLCTAAGLANVTWYDRRAATTANNDLTDYYGANACVTGSGTVSAGIEFQINAAGSADAQCLAGKTVGSAQSWPAGSRAPGDSTSCSEQPELAGNCRHTPNNATDSFQTCNFAATTNTCPINETCQTNTGIPKYGDYNGNACAAGRLYTVWASATPPPGQPATGNVDLYFASNSIPSLFGESASIWRFTGQACTNGSCPGWLALDDNPLTVAITANDTTLFQLHGTGSIWRSTGAPCGTGGCGGWQQLDNNPATTAIAAGGSSLYQLHNDGSIWRSTGAPCGTGGCGGWQQLDNNPATTAIAAAGSSLYQLHNDGSIWRSTGAPCGTGGCGGWQLLDNNTRTGMIAAGGSQLYQEHTALVYQLHVDGSIWRHTGPACGGGCCTGWDEMDNNPATTAVAVGDEFLLQLHDDGSIWRATGDACSGGSCSGWQTLDNNPATTAIAAAGKEAYQLHNDGSIWRSTGAACNNGGCPGWQMLDNNASTNAIAASGNQLFQLHFDGSIWRSTGAGCANDGCSGWQQLDNNPVTTAIAAGGNQLFQLHFDGSIWRSTGAGCANGGCSGWQQLDNNPATTAIAAAGNQLFQLHFDGSIWRSTGTGCSNGGCPGWEQLDNNPVTVAITAIGNDLFQLHDDGSIWRSMGAGCSNGGCPGWERLDDNPGTSSLSAARGEVFQLHNDGSIWRGTGGGCSSSGCPGWVRLDDNPAAKAIAAGGNSLYQLHSDGSIWRATGTPCNGNSCPGWQQLDNNPAAKAIAAGGNSLYQLHSDGSIWRATGTPCNGNSCPGWQQLDNNPAAITIAAAGNQLFQLHKDGSIWRSTGAGCSGGGCPGWQQLDNNPAARSIAVSGAD